MAISGSLGKLITNNLASEHIKCETLHYQIRRRRLLRHLLKLPELTPVEQAYTGFDRKTEDTDGDRKG